MIAPHVDDVMVSLQKFGWPDYVVFLLMLLSCLMIGIFFGFIEKKPKTTADQADDYLVGGRKMSVLPVAMSLVASFISGISLLGTPTEIYVYGVQYMYIFGGVIFMGVGMTFVFLPVFHDLKLTSTYEYLEARFDKKIRTFGALMFTLELMASLPIVIYVPALAFNLVTGINVHLVTPVVCVICIFYTCVGGIKAVVWTDSVQLTLMFGAICLVIVKGTMDVGGFDVVWNRAVLGDRIEGPDMAFDLKSRHTIYSLVFGGFAYWLKSNAVSQNMIQRYLSLPTLAAAKRALWLFIFGVLLLLGMCCYCGLLIYATYYECDPLSTKLVKANDQLLPLLVMKILGDIPGLPGLFIAGVFSAALSSLSTGLNSLSAVILEDFFKTFRKTPLTDKQTNYIMRGVVAVFGTVSVCLVLVVEKLGSVLELSMSLAAVTHGSLLGIFTMGVAMPWVTSNGAIAGGSVGVGVMTWICYMAQSAILSGELSFVQKPVSTAGCEYSYLITEPDRFFSINTTTEYLPGIIDGEVFAIYHLSYLWYTLFGACITIIVSLIVSFVLGANEPSKLRPELLAPIVRKLCGTDRGSIERKEFEDRKAALDFSGHEMFSKRS